MEVEMEFFPRKVNSKSQMKALRRDGKVPCIFYSKGTENEVGLVNKDAVDTVLRELEFGFLPTTIFLLKGKDGKTRKAIIKDIQYHVTTYDVLHVDFLELHADHLVDIKVPVQCLGTIECLGVKAGGFLRQVKQHIEVRCLPRYIPSHFEVDVKDLDVRQVKRVVDIKIPAHVTPRVNSSDVVVTVVK